MDNKQSVAVSDAVGIMAGCSVEEPLRLGGFFKLEKFRVKNPKTGLLELDPFDVIEVHNLVTNVGGALMLDLLAAAGGTAFNNANSYIGIGDSSTAAAVGQTDLQASTNKLRKAMDATFPSRASQVMSYRSTFATTDANYVWNEIGLFNAAAAGSMFSRAVIGSPFTKTSALSVVTTYTLTCP